MKVLAAIIAGCFLACAGAAQAGAADRPEALYVHIFRDADEALDRLDRLADAGEWEQAAEAAQEYIEDADGLFQTEPGRYISFAEAVQRRVFAWPDDGIRAYRELYDDAARRHYEAALDRRSVVELSRLIRRYLPTTYGPQALAARAELRAQRGELRAALRDVRFLRQLEHRTDLPDEPLEAKETALRRALRPPEARLEPSAEHVAGVGRDARRTGLYPQTYRMGVRQWSAPIHQADVDESFARGLREKGRRAPRPNHAAVVGDLAFIQTSRHIAAIDLESGEPAWQWPEEPDGPDRRNLRDAMYAPYATSDRVFAVIDEGLVALSHEGRELWSLDRIVRGDEPRAEDGEDPPPPPEVFANSLAVEGDKLFVLATAARQESEAYAVAFHIPDGTRLWQRRLCSQVFRGVLGRGRHPAPPAVHQGVVYISTNLGAAAAIEAATGEVRWLTEYPAFSPERRRAALLADDSWENNPPVISDGQLLIAPQDSDHLIALDTDDGRVRWKAPRLGMRYLAGSDGRAAFVAGDTDAAAVDVESGKLLWTAELDAPAVARPTLAGDELVVPTRRSLLTLNTDAGTRSWRYRLDEPAERGNVTLAGDRLLLVSTDRIDRYGPVSAVEGDSARALVRRAQRHDRLGDLQTALETYRAALDAPDVGPEGGDLRRRIARLRADAYRRLGEEHLAEDLTERAADAFRAAVEHAPSDELAARAGFRLAATLEAQEEWAEAVARYQHLIEQARGEPVTLDGIEIPAEIAAEVRIASIIDRHGPGPYGELEAAAADLWERAEAAPEAERPALLLLLASQYPNSSLATQARDALDATDRADNARLHRVWRTAFDSSRSSPVVLDGGKYRVDDEPVALFAVRNSERFPSFVWNTVEARRVSDGRVLWRTWVGESASTARVVDGTVVIHGSHNISVLDGATGLTRWTYGPRPEADDPGELPIRRRDLDRIRGTAVGADMILAARASGEIFAMNIETGEQVWDRKLEGHVLAGSIRFDGEAFVVCSETPGAVYRVDPRTGEQIARMSFDRRDDRLTSVPAWQQEARRLAVVVGNHQVRNIDLRREETLWSVDSEHAIGRVVAGPDERHVLILPSRWAFGGKVKCIDATTGEVLWSAEALTKDPDAVYVGRRLMLSVRDNNGPVLIAQRLSDGERTWERRLRRVGSGDTIVGWGEFVVVSGLSTDWFRPHGEASLIRKADGVVARSLEREAGGFTTVRVVDDTLVLCSRRGSEAYRMTTDGELFRRAAARLADDGEHDVGDMAGRLSAAGRHRAAMDRLDRALMAEAVEPERFARLHDRLAAIRETLAEQSRAVYHAPRTARPPELDGRLTDDWRFDRAAVLDQPRNIERIQSEIHPGRFWHGPNDLSAILYVMWDAENLYLAVDVHDDVQVPHDFDADEWEGDCLMVGIDPDHTGGYRYSGNHTVFWLALAAKPREDEEDRDDRERLGGQHRIQIKEDESGTIYELSLPWEDLGVQNPQPGRRIGLNILVIDDDQTGQLKAASWTPGLTQNLNKDMMFEGIVPELFGTVILEGP